MAARDGRGDCGQSGAKLRQLEDQTGLHMEDLRYFTWLSQDQGLRTAYRLCDVLGRIGMTAVTAPTRTRCTAQVPSLHNGTSTTEILVRCTVHSTVIDLI